MPRIFKSPVMTLLGTSATVDLFSDIGSWPGEYNLQAFQNDLAAVKAQGATHLTLRINSNGGDVIEALGIYDAIRASGLPVTAHIVAMAASAATIVACAANEVTMSPNATYMVHEPVGGCFGTYSECQMSMDLFAQLRDRIISIYTAKTGLSEEEVVSAMNPGSYLSSAQARAAHWVDSISGEGDEDEDDEYKYEDDGDEDKDDDKPADSDDEEENKEESKPEAACGEGDDEEEEKRGASSARRASNRQSSTVNRKSGFTGLASSVSRALRAIGGTFLPKSAPTQSELLAAANSRAAAAESALAGAQQEIARLRKRHASRAQRLAAEHIASATAHGAPLPAPSNPPAKPVSDSDLRSRIFQ